MRVWPARPDTPAALRRSAAGSCGLLGALALGGAALASGPGTGGLPAALAAGALALAAVVPIARLAQVGVLAARAARARPVVPRTDGAEPETVAWWSLLRAGFEAEPCVETLQDSALRLGGRPWRVLRRGRLEIPVLRLRAAEAADPARAVRRHAARATAYCRLVEVTRGARSPYAVLLFGSSDAGVTVPARAQADALERAVRGLRETVAALGRARHRMVPLPPDLDRCLDCELGRPDPGGFYSACGARFRWRPPHRQALRRTRPRGRQAEV